MRIATTLLLGAAVLAGASACGIAPGASLKPLPAVPPLNPADAHQSGRRQGGDQRLRCRAAAPAVDAPTPTPAAR